MTTIMAKDDFRRQWNEIEQGYQGRDRRIADLFETSGWTQEDIAAEVGMSQAYVSRMLTFGRFSKFMPNGINCELLTEGAFREHWGKTDPTVADERLRFQAVERALGWPVTPIPAPPPPISARP